MEASIATEPTPTAPGAGNGAAAQRNVGRIEEIQGVVIEAVFPDRLPEINHAITIARPTAAAAEEAEDIAASREAVLVCEVQQHLGDDRVRAVAMDTDRRPGARRRGDRHRRADHGAGRRGHARADLQPARRPDRPRRRAARRRASAAAIHQDGPACRGPHADDRDVRDRHQGHRPARPVRQGRQDRAVRRRRRGQDRADPGADPQPRQGTRRAVGVLRRGRALARGQRPVARDEGVGRASTRRCSSSAR